MKRVGGLYARVAEPENLRLAFWKASRGKRDRPEVRQYAARLEENLARLRQELLAEAVEVGDYRFFTVRDPKERLICAASFPERVLHHAIMNVCEPALERYAIHHTSQHCANLYLALRITGSRKDCGSAATCATWTTSSCGETRRRTSGSDRAPFASTCDPSLGWP